MTPGSGPGSFPGSTGTGLPGRSGKTPLRSPTRGPRLSPGRVIRVTVGIFGGFAGVVVISIIVAAALVLTGDPRPCAPRTSAVSAAAAGAANAKWVAFRDAAPGTVVTFSEAEATSRGVEYVAERDVPLRNLQVYFCADGRAEAKGITSYAGRDINILLRGHLDVTGGRNRIVLDSARAGNLPAAVGTRIASEILDRNGARNLPLGITIASSVSTDGVHTLTR